MVCVTTYPPELDIRDEVVIVRAAGKKITIPAAAAPALKVLLSGHPVNLAELATNTATDTTALAAALTTAGICTELTPALAAGYHDMIMTSPHDMIMTSPEATPVHPPGDHNGPHSCS